MNDEVVNALVGRNFSKTPCVLDDYFVSALEGRYSPGLVRKDGSVAEGLVLHDVDEPSYEIIKAWEANDYTEIEVFPDGGKFGKCYAFLWKSETMNEPWDSHFFRANYLQWYLDVDIPKFKNNHSG